jgi:hypothetical protein
VAILPGCGGGTSLFGGDSGDTPSDGATETAPEATDDGSVETADAPDTAESSDGPADDGATDPCARMDARPEGVCGLVLPGFLWDGADCVPLGSGCSCGGADCAALYETMDDCAAARRDCYAAACTPLAVSYDLCVHCDVDTFLGAFWDGRECFEMIGCGLSGPERMGGFDSLAACEAAFAHCDATLCQATGGEWFPARAGFCGFRCGNGEDITCESPFDSCRCPTGQTFLPGSGCAPDPDCSDRDLCLAGRGSWYPASECYCGFRCGVPGDCEACLDSCDCGPLANFVPGGGCLPDPACEAEPWTEQDLCEATGGAWVPEGEPCSCGHYVCGRPNTTLACCAAGCNCGLVSLFDSTLGCTYAPECLLREDGEECWGGEDGANCRPGLVCCVSCGVAPGCYRCDNPCCSPGSPYCMEDGCPVPPP